MINDEQYKFILNYIKYNGGVSVLNEPFHDAFFSKFGGSRKLKMWGASPVKKAQRLLKMMYNEGTLDRFIITLGRNWEPGFPRWEYVYKISKREKNTNIAYYLNINVNDDGHFMVGGRTEKHDSDGL